MGTRLTNKERAVVEAVNPALTRYLDETGEDWAVRLSALRKVTAMLRAEREALQELAAVGMLQEGVADLAALRSKVDLHMLRMEGLAGENDDLRKRLRQATALPAMAVSGD